MGELIVKDAGKYKKYEELLLKRDQLNKEAGSLNTAYVKEFGELLLKDFELKVECIKKRKMIAYCLAAVNHGEAIDVADMNAKIAHEMAIYELQLKQMASEKEEADKQKASPRYKVERAKRIYRRIAKLIHPDINPAAAAIEEIGELWGRVVIAYHCNDDEELDNLEILVRRVLKEHGSELGAGGQVEIEDIDDRIALLEEQINTIITTEPYVWRELLESPEKIEARRAEIEHEIEESKKYSEELSKILQDIIAGGGAPIAWIQD